MVDRKYGIIACMAWQTGAVSSGILLANLCNRCHKIQMLLAERSTGRGRERERGGEGFLSGGLTLIRCFEVFRSVHCLTRTLALTIIIKFIVIKFIGTVAKSLKP
jgi:hypothetical protein